MTTESTAAPAAETAAAAAPEAAPQDWRASLPDELKPVVERKNFATPADVVKAYDAAERSIGDKVAMPKADAPKAEWDAFWTKAGRPEAPDGYKIAEMLPKDAGVNPEFVGSISSWFHEAGVLPGQAKVIVSKWNDASIAFEKAQEAAQAAEYEATVANLRKEWGAEFDARNADVDRVAADMGLTKEDIAAFRGVIGTERFMKGLAAVGARYGRETAVFVGGGDQSKSAPSLESLFFPRGVGKPATAPAN